MRIRQLAMIECPIFDKEYWNLPSLEGNYSFNPKTNTIHVVNMIKLGNLISKSKQDDLAEVVKKFWYKKVVEDNATWQRFAELYVIAVRLQFNGMIFHPDPAEHEIMVICPETINLRRSIGIVLQKIVSPSKLVDRWESNSIEEPDPGTGEVQPKINTNAIRQVKKSIRKGRR